jgi:diguanylate cyclase (GGDEF)-like protein
MEWPAGYAKSWMLPENMSSSPAGKAQILIIDDEPAVRGVLHALLHESSECKSVGSAEEALELLSAQRFDLVLSDINMPGMSGLEMIPHVLKLAPDTVVVMISGEQSIESAIDSMRVGAYDYIRKPFDIQHVEAAVSRALNHHSLLVMKRAHEDHLEELVRLRTAQVTHLSYHDALTNLPNRTLFEDRVAQAIASAGRAGQKMCVIFLFLDRFKKVNETLGHALGDRLLKEVAERLLKSRSGGETIARFDGEQFALLLTQITSSEYIAKVVERIKAALNLPFAVDDHELFLTISIGVGLCPDDGSDVQTLLKNAGSALNRAREHGGDTYQFYNEEMNAKALQRLALETALRRALEQEEFEVFYQPQIETDSGRIVGMEALVRWPHSELGMIPPADFIPVAEDTGLIVPLGEWILRTACLQTRSWHDEGFTALRVSVNLSARQFQQQNLSETVIRILQETGLNANDLELELTESSIMRNIESAIKTLGELKAMGVTISIDDFGTGFSSLGYLKSLPIDVLKIDKSFVRDVTTNPDDASLAMAIITLAHNLRLRVIAEGVETEEQLKFLHLLRCDEWQGYLFSKPVPADVFGRLLAGKDAFVIH